MKKYTKITYIIIALMILLFGFFIYKVFGKNASDQDIKSKAVSEINYIESKFLNLFNKVNNISFENYKISSTEIKKQESESKSSSTSEASGNGGQSSGKSEQSGGTEKSNGGQSSSDSSNTSSNSSKGENKQFKLEETGILTKDSNIDWKQMKNDVEGLYSSLYTTTLDLYQLSSNQEDIVNFNKEYDNLTKAVKEENKEGTLVELSILYEYLPKFMENCTDEEKQKIVIKTKNSIFKSYSILDQENWPVISENVNNAAQEFTKLVTSVTNQEKGSQYNINKVYIMINELQNAVVLRDKEVFLIKYKNLLEELQNI